MRLVWTDFDTTTGLGLCLQDDTGTLVAIPTVHTYGVTQGRQESTLIGDGHIVYRDLEPSTLHVKFIGGELVLEVKRDGWQA